MVLYAFVSLYLTVTLVTVVIKWEIRGILRLQQSMFVLAYHEHPLPLLKGLNMRNYFVDNYLLHEVTVTKNLQIILQHVPVFVCIPHSHLSHLTTKKENRIMQLEDRRIYEQQLYLFSPIVFQDCLNFTLMVLFFKVLILVICYKKRSRGLTQLAQCFSMMPKNKN